MYYEYFWFENCREERHNIQPQECAFNAMTANVYYIIWCRIINRNVKNPFKASAIVNCSRNIFEKVSSHFSSRFCYDDVSECKIGEKDFLKQMKNMYHKFECNLKQISKRMPDCRTKVSLMHHILWIKCMTNKKSYEYFNIQKGQRQCTKIGRICCH